jgi:23S rRNA pseudouridine1911/1915/1917 synthase
MNEDEAAGQQETDELYEHFRIVADKGQSLLRVDKFLLNRLENTSRNRIQVAAEAGIVQVNGKPVKSSYKIKPGDVVTIVLAHPPRDVDIIAENIPLDIVYEDRQVIVINKAPGMVVHPAYGNYSGTLVNAVSYHLYPHLEGKKIGSETVRPGMVHRIDKNTSGLIVLAKDERSMTLLARQFYERTIDRNYLALVWGDFEENEGKVTGNIGRSIRDRKLMDVFPDGSHGKYAATHYKVLERFGYVTLISCKLETGRTHQIRVHMKHIRHPLFNDETYGGDKILKGTTFARYRQFVENCFSLMPRQALHAQSLGFIHPETGKKMFFESNLPDDFQSVLEKWRSYVSNPV